MAKMNSLVGGGATRNGLKGDAADTRETGVARPQRALEDPQSLPSFESSQGMHSHRERDDNYHAIAVRLSYRWRVIICRDALQWIVQRRRDAGRRGSEWKGIHYCASRKALIRLSDASCRDMSTKARAVLEELPDRIGHERN